MSEIVVTGGNGFVGRHLVAALLDRGDRVRVLALPAEDAGWLASRGVTIYRGDVRDQAALTELMRGADAVVHLAAMMDVWRPLSEYRAVNVSGTRNVCRAALAAGVGRLVHMSSSSVYGPGHRRPADEDTPLTPFGDPYPVSKAEADLDVQRMIADEGLPAVIVRPDQIFGPGDRLHFGKTADRLAAGRCVIVGRGDNALPLVYVTDAVAGLLLALQQSGAAGRAYNIGHDRPVTQRQFLDAIADHIGARRARARLPYPALYLAGYLAERLATMAPGGRRPPITRLGVAFLGADGRFAIDRARRELGYRPQVEISAGVRSAAAWYLEGGRPSPQRSDLTEARP